MEECYSNWLLENQGLYHLFRPCVKSSSTLNYVKISFYHFKELVWRSRLGYALVIFFVSSSSICYEMDSIRWSRIRLLFVNGQPASLPPVGIFNKFQHSRAKYTNTQIACSWVGFSFSLPKVGWVEGGRPLPLFALKKMERPIFFISITVFLTCSVMFSFFSLHFM